MDLYVLTYVWWEFGKRHQGHTVVEAVCKQSAEREVLRVNPGVTIISCRLAQDELPLQGEGFPDPTRQGSFMVYRD